jgi:flagellar basal-body rod modification protein FlgD
VGSVLDALSGAAGGTAAATTTRNEAGAEDRFLKLLVAQMKNQDPLNPMDNAQVTSQMAQIQTVSGVERLNQGVEALGGHFAQMRALQGASLVGRDVVVAGDWLAADAAGTPRGGFELAAAADSVRVEILNRAGIVIDRVDLGAQSSGRQGFEWRPKEGVDLAAGERFRVVARSGGKTVAATALAHDRVDAVSNGDTLTLELRRGGSVAYADVKAFH